MTVGPTAAANWRRVDSSTVTGTAAGDVELYVQTVQTPNAYAAGDRSVAVTSRAVKD